MKIEFFGTRGNIIKRTRLHYRHTITSITYKKKRILVDCGEDWTKEIKKLINRKKSILPRPHAIIITHAHSDHVKGLKYGSPCPVYATRQTWKVIDNYPIKKKYKKVLSLKKSVQIANINIKAYKIYHSHLVHTVGLKITAGTTNIFIAHDVAGIPN